MGKASRKKHEKNSRYPFLLLTMWIKVYHAEGERCRCGTPAAYACEHYIDIAQMTQLTSQGVPRQQALDIVWNTALKNQLQGTYMRTLTTYHCNPCTFKVCAIHAGEQVATLLMLPMMAAGGRLSLLLLNRLDSSGDVGQPCATSVAATTIEEVARGLRAKAIPIPVKG